MAKSEKTQCKEQSATVAKRKLPNNKKKRTDADTNATIPMAGQFEMRLRREGHDM